MASRSGSLRTRVSRSSTRSSFRITGSSTDGCISTPREPGWRVATRGRCLSGGNYFAAPPPTLLPVAPFALLPEPLGLVLLTALVVVASVATIRLLRLPWWWILFPPLVQCLISANVQAFLLPRPASRRLARGLPQGLRCRADGRSATVASLGGATVRCSCSQPSRCCRGARSSMISRRSRTGLRHRRTSPCRRCSSSWPHHSRSSRCRSSAAAGPRGWRSRPCGRRSSTTTVRSPLAPAIRSPRPSSPCPSRGPVSSRCWSWPRLARRDGARPAGTRDRKVAFVPSVPP